MVHNVVVSVTSTVVELNSSFLQLTANKVQELLLIPWFFEEGLFFMVSCISGWKSTYALMFELERLWCASSLMEGPLT